MGDLFHPDVPFYFVCKVMAIAAACPHHKFLFLTKRAVEMHDYFTASPPLEFQLPKAAAELGVLDRIPGQHTSWPPPNVWLGVTAENQARADERIPVLLSIPAAVHFVSIEPCLGPVDLDFDRITSHTQGMAQAYETRRDLLKWVILGGESGPGARPMRPDWALWVRNQCQAAGVPFLFKQYGEWRVLPNGHTIDTAAKKWKREYDETSQAWYFRVGKKVAGRELDGRTWDEYPG
jgi:protein gp37